MFRLFEQNRLGSYDPILLGTLCNIDAVTLHPEYQKFLHLGMRAFLAQPDDDHRRFVEAQKSTEDKVLALFTLFSHENRHFWDSVTTCSGLRLARAALELQHEFITCCTTLLNSRGALYFPFSEWVRDRTKLGRVSPALATPPPEAEAFAASAERFLQEHQQWELGGRDPSGSPSSSQIIEGLAVAVQGEAIRHYFGDDARALFYDTLRASETGRWYLGAIDYVRSRLPELDLDGQGLLLEMSLYGSVDLPAREGSPAAVLPYLIEQLEQQRPRFPESFVELFVLCDGYISLLQRFGPALSYRNAGRALLARLNELATATTPWIQVITQGPRPIETTSSVLDDLFAYYANTVNLGARLVQKVLFAGNVGNLRITVMRDGLYNGANAPPYFESGHGLIVGGSHAAHVHPLIGGTMAPGWKKARFKGFERRPEDERAYLELYRRLPDEKPVHELYIFAPVADGVPDYWRLSWKLFPHMLGCRMAIAGPSETHSIASVLLSAFLRNLGPVYARKRRIAPLDKSDP